MGTWVKDLFRNLVPDFLTHTPWRTHPYEKYPRRGVLAHVHMFPIQSMVFHMSKQMRNECPNSWFIQFRTISPTEADYPKIWFQERVNLWVSLLRILSSTARVSLRKYFVPGCVGRGVDLDLRVHPAARAAPAASGNVAFFKTKFAARIWKMEPKQI